MVEMKHQQKSVEKTNEQSLASILRQRVQKIDEMDQVSNNLRFMKRSTVALENMGVASQHKQAYRLKHQAAKDQMKVELAASVAASKVHVDLEKQDQRQKVKQHYEEIKKQIQDKKDLERKQKQIEREQHMKDLALQEIRFNQRQRDLQNHNQSIVDRDDKINKAFVDPKVITHCKELLVKAGKVDQLVSKMGSVEDLRNQERDNDLIRRRQIIEKETMDWNRTTVDMRNLQKQVEKTTRKLVGQAENVPIKQAASGLNLNQMNISTSPLPKPAKKKSGVDFFDQGTAVLSADKMRGAIGIRKPSPERLTTTRQVQELIDQVQFKKKKQMEKEALRLDLLQQIKEKQFRKERDRVLIDKKILAMNRSKLASMGVVLPSDSPPETETDLNKLASVENFTKN